MEGWIKLHRKLIDWEWYTYPNATHFFIYCLIKANHKDKKWRGVNIKRGSFITSLDTISADTGMTKRQVRTVIDKLCSTSEIKKEATHCFTHITICKYDSYQKIDTSSDTQSTQVRHSSDTVATQDRHTSDTEATLTNNEKNIKNDNNEKKKKGEEIIENNEVLEIDSKEGKIVEFNHPEKNKSNPLPPPKFSDPLVKYLESGLCPDFFWECFEILIDWSTSKKLFIDWHTYNAFKSNRDAAIEIFNGVRIANNISEDGEGVEKALKTFLDNYPSWWLENFSLKTTATHFEKIYNQSKSKKSKPDARYGTREKFERAAKESKGKSRIKFA